MPAGEGDALRKHRALHVSNDPMQESLGCSRDSTTSLETTELAPVLPKDETAQSLASAHAAVRDEDSAWLPYSQSKYISELESQPCSQWPEDLLTV